MRAGRQGLGVGGPGGLEQQVAGLADAAADDDDRRVEHDGEVGDALPQPLADAGEQPDRGRVPGRGSLGDHRTGHRLRIAAGELEQRGAGRAILPAERTGLPDQGPPGAVLLPAAVIAAAAREPAGNHAHVADLGGRAERAAHELAAQHDPAAEPGADGHEDHVRVPPAAAEPVLAPGGGVRVVLHDDRPPDGVLDDLAQRPVDHRQVRREPQRRPRLVDEAGHGEADRRRRRGR